ncbi:hypothetical protein HWC21_gp085 [Vibrio phage VAP7]|uniref:Uncharacterized protein n=1 Tax=Vibrio phage VAP7 TaxID=2584487 RepID=A0A4Y5TXD6_9CAUD|nr:hypothetical protein HWC21_gp085 [Vibrio phage VAP7]QDB73267.1 hypothetical protein [Vibrio phage VAP7]UFD98048.1 hypothetical protein [Vibrio phage BX-1]
MITVAANDKVKLKGVNNAEVIDIYSGTEGLTGIAAVKLI